MTDTPLTRVVIVGGGLSGMAIALEARNRGFDVLVLEARRVGEGASTRNQGWLHSGGWFARSNRELAQACRTGLEATLAACPECVEPGHEGMLYCLPADEESDWEAAWSSAGIEAARPSEESLLDRLPGLSLPSGQTIFQLPDRSVRFDVLLGHLTTRVLAAEGEIRTGCTVTRLVVDEGRVVAVETGEGERVEAGVVVIAGNAGSTALVDEACGVAAGRQAPFEWVPVKTHLIAVDGDVFRWPFCLTDRDGLHHVPHGRLSVFGTSRWHVTSDPADRSIDPVERDRLRAEVAALLPDLDLGGRIQDEWAGTTMQAMHDEQVVPGATPLPSVLDHARTSRPLENLVSVFPGRATLWQHVAAEVGCILDRHRVR